MSVWITMSLFAARFVVGVKLVMALLDASAIVPLISVTVRSALLSPSTTVILQVPNDSDVSVNVQVRPMSVVTVTFPVDVQTSDR